MSQPQIRIPPTPRQAAILAFLREFIAAKGYAPTQREIGDGCNIKHLNGVRNHLLAMQRRGLVHILPGAQRNVVPTE